MYRKIVFLVAAGCLCFALAACSGDSIPGESVVSAPGTSATPQVTAPSPSASEEQTQVIAPTVGGIALGDSADKVLAVLGNEYVQTAYDEAEHFPETFYNWDYRQGYTITIGQNTHTVLQIMATKPNAGTNLNVGIGDKADEVLGLYRQKYEEPVSIHGGGRLLGVFKVEMGQALLFDFNIDDGIVNPVEEIEPDDTVERIILTYPAYLDDSF